KPAIVSAPAETKSVSPTVQAKPVALPTPAAVVRPPAAVAPLPAPVAAVPVNAAPVVSEPIAPVAPPVVDPASEELKRQSARLQEQLSTLLFEETPAATPPPDPERPVLQLGAIAMSDATAQIFEMTNPESAGSAPKSDMKPTAPQTSVPSHDTVSKAKSGLQDEEVKIPAWLEPLARNAAVPPVTRSSTQATPLVGPEAPSVGAETPVPVSQPIAKANVVAFPLTIATPHARQAEATTASESYDFGNEIKQEPIATKSEPQGPKFNSNLFGASEETYSEEHAS